MNIASSVLTSEGIDNIRHECDLLREHTPNFAPIIIAAIEQGKIYGARYVLSSSPDCGCIYGHIAGLDEGIAEDTAHIMQARLDTFGYTPIERLIFDIIPGQTHENSSKLAEFRQILLTYVLAEK